MFLWTWRACLTNADVIMAYLPNFLFVRMQGRPHRGHENSAPPRGAGAGTPATRSRSYRYITTLANPGVQVVPHPHPPGRTEPHPRDTHTPNEGTPTNKQTLFWITISCGFSLGMNSFWTLWHFLSIWICLFLKRVSDLIWRWFPQGESSRS